MEQALSATVVLTFFRDCQLEFCSSEMILYPVVLEEHICIIQPGNRKKQSGTVPIVYLVSLSFGS